jgi:hypothetical protein
LSGFCRIRLSHRNVGVFRTVRRFLYRRRRRVWELAQVKSHNDQDAGTDARDHLVSSAICGEICAFLFSLGPGCALRLALAVTDLFAEG